MLRQIPWLLLGLAIFFLSGCDLPQRLGAKKADFYASPPPPTAAPVSAAGVMAERMAGESLPPSEPSPKKKVERKIIYSSYLKLEVKEVSKTIDQIKVLAKQNKGYLQSSSITKYENQGKSGNAILKVPPANLDVIVAQLKKLGEVVDESQKAEDITKEYYDVEARLKNTRKFEARLLKLLETKTTKVGDVLDVERELSRVRENVESLQGTLRYYQSFTNLATITIDLYEKGVTIPTRVNILQPIIDTFGEAFGAFFVSVGAIVILIFGVTPWLLLLAVLIYIIALIWKRVRRVKS